MKLKRFFAADMRQAMAKVRETFGDDAVIISNQRHKEGVELLAAIDFDENMLTNLAIEQETATPTLVAENLPLNSKNKSAVQWDFEDKNIQSLKDQISALTEYTKQQFSQLAWKEQAASNPDEALLFRHLADLGLHAPLVRKIIDSISVTSDLASNRTQSMSTLRKLIPIRHENIIQEGGIVALLGSTGVGKTTTLAKLAAHFCLENSPDDLGLITMDTYRIGAVEQLQMYANILGCKTTVVNSSDKLIATLKQLSDKKLILIDTAGMSQRDMRLTEQLNCLQDTSFNIRCSLVLSATSQYAVLHDAIKAFKQFTLSDVIVTKIDECVNFGEILSELISAGLPISYLCNGQRVPEDVQAASRELIEKVLTSLASQYALPIHHQVLAQAYQQGEYDVVE